MLKSIHTSKKTREITSPNFICNFSTIIFFILQILHILYIPRVPVLCFIQKKKRTPFWIWEEKKRTRTFRLYKYLYIYFHKSSFINALLKLYQQQQQQLHFVTTFVGEKFLCCLQKFVLFGMVHRFLLFDATIIARCFFFVV